ncbi:MAG: abortive infection family protein [Candidatus Binataceae bacterium]
MEWPSESEERAELFLGLQKAIVASFDDGDWKELGYETGTIDWIDEHPRLLRSLRWNDPDYGGHAFDALEMLRRKNARSLDILLGKEKIRRRLKADVPALYARYVEETAVVPEAVPDFEPQAINPTEAMMKALENARLLISSGDPIGAIDRVHTSLHSYLIEACGAAGIAAKTDAGITELYKLLREQHTKLRDLGAQSEEINKILRSLSAVLDAFNPLRNRGSLAHPNQSLVKDDEAMLVINAARSILHYLDGKFGR